MTMQNEPPCNLMRIVRVPSTLTDPSRYYDKDANLPPILSPKKIVTSALIDEHEEPRPPLPRSYRQQLAVPEQKAKRYLDYVYKSAQASRMTRDSVTVELIDRLADSMVKSLLRSSAEDLSRLIDDYVDELISSEFTT